MNAQQAMIELDAAPAVERGAGGAAQQYMTPAWAAERLVELYFGDLTAADQILEPTCGTGAFLAAIPAHVPALGVEQDPALAALAECASGRHVIRGNALAVDLPVEPTVVVGNPPFRARFIRALLDRCHDWLPEDGRVGMILPAYLFNYAEPTAELLDRWRIRSDHIPRTLWPRLTHPLVFAVLTKGGETRVGFALYREAASIAELSERFRAFLDAPSRSVWRQAVADALMDLGGEASLEQLYRVVATRRPTRNRWWREKVRQVLQEFFERVGPGRYRIPAEVAA